MTRAKIVRLSVANSPVVIGVGILFICFPSLSAFAVPSKPGVWTMTTSNVITGSPPELVQLMNALEGKSLAVRICITPEQIARNKPGDPPMPFARDRACSLTNVRSTEGAWSGELVCTPESKNGSTTIESIHDSEHFKQKMVSSREGLQIVTTMEGRWLSDDCSALSRARNPSNVGQPSSTGKSVPSRADGATCVPNRFPADLWNAPRRDLTATDVVHVVLNGINFAIPRNYFGSVPQGCGAEELGLYLRAILPDFSGATAETSREFNQGLGRTVRISLRHVQQMEHVEDFIRSWTNDYANSKVRVPVTWDDAEVYGLQHGTIVRPSVVNSPLPGLRMSSSAVRATES